MRYLSVMLILVIPIFLFSDLQFNINDEQLREITEYNTLEIPGEPIIKKNTVKILLPFGEKVTDIKISLENKINQGTKSYKIAKNPQPLSQKFFLDTKLNYNVLKNNAFYPKNDFKNYGIQFYKGYAILILDIYNHKINPVTKEKIKFNDVNIIVKTKKDDNILKKESTFLSSKPILNNVLNLDAIKSYKKIYKKSYSKSRESIVDSSDPYKMIIVTSQNSLNYFWEYINWKNENGISTTIFTMEDIYADYEGIDQAEQLRNFVIDAYTSYSSSSTPLEYLLLGGDTEIVPFRGCFGTVGEITDNQIPTDMYFSCLDGNWNANNNNLWGEFNDEVDLYPEISVGRIPAETEEEFNNFFNKAYTYVENHNYTNNIAHFIGERLDNIPTWGGDYLDEMESYFPNEYHITKKYQKLNTFSLDSVLESYNEGFGIINHMGHANTDFFMELNGNLVMTLNNDKYGFVYSQGCYPASFDLTSQAGGEAVAEHLIIQNGGALGFIGNTRYGWYMQGSTNGVSQAYAINFFESLFTDNILQIGKTLDSSKLKLVSVALNNPWMRWVYYELVLLGDPSLELILPSNIYPNLSPEEITAQDITGDEDGIVNPGETFSLSFDIKNKENWNNATNVGAKVIFNSNSINTISDSVYYGDINSGTISNVEENFVFEIAPGVSLSSIDYRIIITADDFKSKFERNIPLSLYQTNWPVNTTSLINSGFMLNNNQEILTLDINSNICKFSLNGTEYNINENNENIGRNDKSVAYADINKDGEKDIIFNTRRGYIVCKEQNGNNIFSVNIENAIDCTPVISDFDNDGNYDIATIDIRGNLYIYDKNGIIFPNMPKNISDERLSGLAVEDINGNSEKNIIITSRNGNLYVLDKEGNNIEGFPITIPKGFVTSPLILDNKNIVISSDNKLCVYSPTGEEISVSNLEGRILNSPIALDFDNDSELEIALVTLSRKMYIIEQNGNILDGWPQDFSDNVRLSLLSADIDNDGILEIIAQAQNGNILIKKANNENTKKITLNKNDISSGLLEDIDNDNDLDLVFATNNDVSIIDFKTEKGTLNGWRCYKGNYRRTNSCKDNSNNTNINNINTINSLIVEQNHPNPFFINNERSLTEIDFYINKPGIVNTTIFNLKGQKIIEIENKYYEKGEHTVYWNGKNNSGVNCPSGIYLYRIKHNKENKIKRLIIVK